MIYIKTLKINMILFGFNINGKHKYTKDKYDPNGFDINGKHKDANNEYDPNGFDIYYT